MAKKSTTTLEFKGTFDVSDIISKVKSLKSTLAQSGAKGEDILNIDNSIKKMEQLQSKINTLRRGGYSSNTDIENLANTYREVYELARQANSAMESIRLTKVNSGTDAFKKALNAANEAVKQLGNSIKNDIVASLGKVKGNKALAQTFIDGAKMGRDYKDVQAEINRELDRQVQLQKENVKAAKDLVAAAEKEKTDKLAENLGNAGLTKQNIRRQSFRTLDKKDIDASTFQDVQQLYTDAIANNTSKKQALTAFKKSLKEINVEFRNQETIIKAIEKSFNIKDTGIAAINSQITSLSKSSGAAEANFKTLKSQVDNFKTSMASGGDTEKFWQDLVKSLQDAETAQSKLNAETLKAALGAEAYKKLEAAIKGEEQALKAEEKAAKDSLKTHETVESAFGRLTNAFERYFSATYIIRSVSRVIRETFNDIEKLDKAFASIAMVTDKTVADLWGSYGEYQDIANKLGQSTESAIKASALYYQQGLDTAEALRLTEDTMKLATLAGADFETATRQMTAALRGFHMEMSEGAHITDVYSELAANAAADVNGIAYAMSKAASIADSAGMSFENTAAFITNMINVALQLQRSLVMVTLH